MCRRSLWSDAAVVLADYIVAVAAVSSAVAVGFVDFAALVVVAVGHASLGPVARVCPPVRPLHVPSGTRYSRRRRCASY